MPIPDTQFSIGGEEASSFSSASSACAVTGDGFTVASLLDKSDEEQQEKGTEDFFMINWLIGSGSIYKNFILQDKYIEEK